MKDLFGTLLESVSIRIQEPVKLYVKSTDANIGNNGIREGVQNFKNYQAGRKIRKRDNISENIKCGEAEQRCKLCFVPPFSCNVKITPEFCSDFYIDVFTPKHRYCINH